MANSNDFIKSKFEFDVKAKCIYNPLKKKEIEKNQK